MSWNIWGEQNKNKNKQKKKNTSLWLFRRCLQKSSSSSASSPFSTTKHWTTLARVSAFLKWWLWLICWEEEEQCYLLRSNLTLIAILHLCNSNYFNNYPGLRSMGIRPSICKTISQKLFLSQPRNHLVITNPDRRLSSLRDGSNPKILSVHTTRPSMSTGFLSK